MIGLLVLMGAMTDVQVGRAIKLAPPPVRAFIERRAGCNHWGGEEAYDKDRGREIEAATRKLRCGRIEADERGLRRRYADRPPVLELLTQTADRDD